MSYEQVSGDVVDRNHNKLTTVLSTLQKNLATSKYSAIQLSLRTKLSESLDIIRIIRTQQMSTLLLASIISGPLKRGV